MHAYLIEGNDLLKIDKEITRITAKNEKGKTMDFALQKIEEVKEISNLLKLSSREHLTLILRDVDNLSLEASNALLKTLEEPPKEVTFILTTHSCYLVPPTILSRCQLIKTQKTKEVDEKTLTEFAVFLDSTTSKKLSLTTTLSGRAPAIEFLETSILSAHKLLQEGKGEKDKLVNFLTRADSTLAAIKANGNVKLQLTNLFIGI